MSDSAQLDHIVTLIRKALADRPHVAELEGLAAETELGAAGIDSLDLIVVFSHFEKRWGIPFEDAEIDPSMFDTVGDLAARLLAQARAHGKELTR
ncbi:phosphopantetheine-binding protein [Marinactinospora thermotolerans]|uniref:Phosphopantetheine attachment site n=2 Tax=Marinactinospora thermotolerans TaxID=531310 RepID=A0A1T4T401_9ACTN|nr:phosphopantetheine-binding protein [Marinactinospora thermotolerans]AET51858.1 ACP [Marinactinospora thermotolerans]SKA35202.1 Phosphopantetheine attachment site [Marinactinospora thermotolerans DSM 45154]